MSTETNNAVSVIGPPASSLVGIRPAKRVFKIMDLNTDPRLNTREDYDYAIDRMVADIYRLGRITNPIIVMLKKDGTNVVLQGNRRTLGGKKAHADPTCPVAVHDALDKVECLVYKEEELSEADVMRLICDEGSSQPISKLAIVKTCWRLKKQQHNATEIADMMYSQLARLTGNEKKLRELEGKSKEDREKALATWFKGTLGDWILKAIGFPEFAKEQFLLYFKNQDGKLAEGEKIEVSMSRTRVNELGTAKGKDVKANAWDYEKGGPEFQALWSKFKDEDAGLASKDKDKRPGVGKLTEWASNYQSEAVRLGLLIATGVPQPTLADLDAETYRLSQIVKTIREVDPANVKDVVIQAFCNLLLSGSPGEVKTFLTSH